MLLALPLVVVAGLAGVLGETTTQIAVIGALLYVAGVALHWCGRDLGAGVLPGAAAGLVPLALGLLMGMHGCVGGSCMSMCVPVCAGAGAIAGLVIAAAAQERSLRAPFWLSAGTVALLTGALGCACVGFGGIVGLAAGMALPVAAGISRTAFARSR
jgi:hypothetical protein